MIIVRNILGPCTLVKAWDQTRHDGAFRLLEEIHLQQDNLYPNMTQRGVGEHCHWVVHDRAEHEVYFYSRIVGSNICEVEKPQNDTIATLGL